MALYLLLFGFWAILLSCKGPFFRFVTINPLATGCCPVYSADHHRNKSGRWNPSTRRQLRSYRRILERLALRLRVSCSTPVRLVGGPASASCRSPQVQVHRLPICSMDRCHHSLHRWVSHLHLLESILLLYDS